MRDMPDAADLLAQLCRKERSLLRRHGVRLRVDKITADGRSAICSAGQVRRGFLRSALSTEKLVSLAHAALVPLNQVGLQPFVSVLVDEPRSTFTSRKEEDPFGLRNALREAGMEEMLLPAPSSSSDRRSAP